MTESLKNAIDNVTDCYVDNNAMSPCGWAMYAYITVEGFTYRLCVIPTQNELTAIDNGDAELHFIDYSNPTITRL